MPWTLCRAHSRGTLDRSYWTRRLPSGDQDTQTQKILKLNSASLKDSIHSQASDAISCYGNIHTLTSLSNSDLFLMGTAKAEFLSGSRVCPTVTSNLYVARQCMTLDQSLQTTFSLQKKKKKIAAINEFQSEALRSHECDRAIGPL